MKRFFYISLLFFAACKNPTGVVRTADYKPFLTNRYVQQKNAFINREINFWQGKLKQDTAGYAGRVKLANAKIQLFKLKGDVMQLTEANSLLQKTSAKINNTDAELMMALSQYAIMQHRFKDADTILQTAINSKNTSMYEARLLQFDSKMEVGDFRAAKMNLKGFFNKEDFNYLIRISKQKDHEGDINASISYLEKALSKVSKENKELMGWVLTNLADKYGHAGRISDSYAYYKKSLALDSCNWQALKGMAWIAYSHDHNAAVAKEILHFINTVTNMPDTYLLLAEIETFLHNDAMAAKYSNTFKKLVTNTGYGAMYNKYVLNLYINGGKIEDAIALAKQEVNNRPTPEVYCDLALAYCKAKNYHEALAIVNRYVYKQSFEPKVLDKLATIYSIVGEKQKAADLWKECLHASFEIGPLQSQAIEASLKQL